MINEEKIMFVFMLLMIIQGTFVIALVLVQRSQCLI